MLIEAMQLLRNQREQGFEETSAHESFATKLGAYRTLRLCLNQDGSIHSLEAYSREDEAAFWTLVKGTSAKAKRFPALRPLHPLLVLATADERWTLIEKLSSENLSSVRDCLLSLIHELERYPQDFSDAWTEKAKPILSWDDKNATGSVALLKKCVNAFGRFTGLAESAHESGEVRVQAALHARRITDLLVDACQISLAKGVDVEAIEAFVHLVVGKRVKKKTGKVERIDSAQLCIDLYDEEDPSATIYSMAMHPAVKSRLPGSSTPGVCALSGNPGPLLVSKFPVWDGKLFVKGIYSKNEAAPCNSRYHRGGLEGFSVSEKLARWLTSGLGAMTESSRENKTWAKLYNGKYNRASRREEQDLLLVYPSFPVEELHTIDVFKPRRAGGDDEEDERRLDFETHSSSLCARLRRAAATSQEISPCLRIMLVRKVSEGQIQLAYFAQPSIDQFAAALKAWEMSGHNLPPGLVVPLPSPQSASHIGWFVPKLLLPEEISRLLTHQWIRDGTETSRVEAPPIGMVFDLFLRKTGVWQDHAQRLLEITLARTATLLTCAGEMLHKYDRDDPAKWTDFVPKTPAGKPDTKKADPRYCFAKTLSLIGSLLYAMNSTASEYMNTSAFLVGKLLAMMDELHKCYCVASRDGDVPNTLIGNGLLGRAGESPAQALADMCERSRIYLGWAETVSVPAKRDNENARQKNVRIAILSAKKILREVGPLADELHRANDLEQELAPAAKAHLFLGYLSPVLGKDQEPVAENQDDTNTTV